MKSGARVRRRSRALMIGALLMAVAVVTVPRPAGAAPANDIDPTLLALPASALPSGATIDYQGVSDNADADNKSNLHILHQNLYETLGRKTGYRLDIRYTVQGNPVGTEYLASIFDTPDKAQAAMNDAIGPGTLITLFGHPLAPCTVGDKCQAYYGVNPIDTTQEAVVAIFTDGPILVETANQAPAANFTTIQPALQSTLFGFLQAADAQIKIALSGGPKTTGTTVVATDTPTATPTDTATPKPKVSKHCKKGYHLVHGKCKKKKKKH